MTTHKIRTVEVRPGRFVASCSCGKYKSKAFFYPGYAQSAGAGHVSAKVGAR
ncbi:hypothetical protein AB0J14_04435 [Micromonospora arborensis]|uniref:hypothetical protein n=1 Tax=Micromonospora arborensis TaxID=2116518 RepID=UPI0033DCC74B